MWVQRLMCRLDIRHEWHVETTEDGGRYKHCRTCGKYDDRGGTGGPGDWAAPIGM